MTGGAALEIVETGWSTTIQDRGRPGFAHLGVPTAGAVDQPLAALVNRLVGNDEAAAVLETAGGLVVRASGPVLVATSAELAPRTLAAGGELTIAVDGERTWSYLAVRGGIAVETVLESRSHDTLSGIGPPPLAPGVRLLVGIDPATAVTVDVAQQRRPPERVRVWPGPRVDWFDIDAMAHLTTGAWTVGTVSRVGLRLTGVAVRRQADDELASEGLVAGAIQVPPDGQPVVMLADHPTTGGYPVVAVVDPDDLPALAQRRVGSTVRFSHAQ
ncbi:MAG TPA: biotin-dependent carboxyltransferase family protein [Ilumatobacteraceae bacterium]|nr:biotin-dependent carboxyltransferase family protein [Ilumatobacteraceae bacterium]